MMPFAYQLPILPPYQKTFIERRVAVPVFEHGIKDGTFYSTSYFIHPEIKNPFYNDAF